MKGRLAASVIVIATACLGAGIGRNAGAAAQEERLVLRALRQVAAGMELYEMDNGEPATTTAALVESGGLAGWDSEGETAVDENGLRYTLLRSRERWFVVVRSGAGIVYLLDENGEWACLRAARPPSLFADAERMFSSARRRGRFEE